MLILLNFKASGYLPLSQAWASMAAVCLCSSVLRKEDKVDA